MVILGLVLGTWGGVATAARTRGGSGSSDDAVTFVGRVKGLDAVVAIVVADDVAFGYLCDGAELSEWFRGTVDEGSIALLSPDGSALAAAKVGKRVEGVVFVGGETAEFTLKRAKGDAGLFRDEQVIEGVGYAAGWVVLPGGETLGQVSLANVTGARQLPPPPPAGATVTTAAAAVEAVGVVAPREIAGTFSPEPPADSQVVVVPFSAEAVTSETPGGSNPPADGDTTATTAAPVPQVDCTVVGPQRDGVAAEIRRVREQLRDESDRKQRFAIKIQLIGLERQLKALDALFIAGNCRTPTPPNPGK